MSEQVTAMAGRLTTHVLDIARGQPAANMAIELWRVDASGAHRTLLQATRTMANGRTEAPLLAEGELTVGTYELVFAVGDYFAGQGGAPQPFLDRVPVRFAVSDPAAHYHVPLLVSPWAYSTYRGS